MPEALMYGVTLTVQAALSTATSTYGTWNAALWNSALWGPDVVWVDISKWVETVSTGRRFSRDLQSWEAGQATILLNNQDGRFSSENLSGPYVVAGITGIRPWRPIRVLATYAGITYPVYTGYALAWNETYVEPYPGGGGAFVSVPCVDELGRLAGFDGLARSPVGAGETVGRRVHRLLDTAGHTGNRAIDSGVITVQATIQDLNTVQELQLNTDSEGGALWVETDGTVTFANRFALIENTRSNTVQATYGEGVGELAYSDVTLTNSGDLISNIAAFSRVGGTAQVATDESSRALYQDKRKTRTDLVCETDAQVAGLADVWVARYAQPELRVTSVTLKPRGAAATMFPEVLGRRVRDLVRVKRRPPGGFTVTRDCFVSGIGHEITKDSWTTTYEMWSATAYSAFSTSRWDAGIWNTSTWFI